MIYKKLFPVCFSLAVMAMGAQDLSASASVSGDRLERQVVMMEKMLTPSFPEAMIPASLKRMDELMKNENLTPSQAQRLAIVKAGLEQKMGGAPKEEVMAPAVVPGTADVGAQIKGYINESALIAGAPKNADARQRLDALRQKIAQTLKNPGLSAGQQKELLEMQGDMDELDKIVPKAKL